MTDHELQLKAVVLRRAMLGAMVILSFYVTGFAQTTNSFFRFVREQSERHYSNVPHEVLAFYYGWYGNPKNPAWGIVDTNKHEIANTARFPVKGAYSSHDPAVIEWQIDQAKAVGITGFVVSWWGRGDWDKWHDESLAILLQCAARKNFKISIYWERAPGDGQGQINEAIDDISYVLNKYGKSKAFLKVDDKPVIFAYNRVTIFSVPVSSWPAIIQGVRKRAGDFVFMGDIGDDQQSPNAYLFDGIHAYWVSLPDDLGKHLTMDKLGELKTFLANFNIQSVRVARRHDRISCLTVTPGSDCRKAYKWDTQTDRINGQTYKTYWEEAIKANPDWIIINSWNEWPEGTEIEPGLELGDQYLQITAGFTKRFLESPVVAASEAIPLPRFLPGTTNDLSTILLNRKVGVLALAQIETKFWLAYCGATVQSLDWKDLIDPKIFNARDLPLFICTGDREFYVSSVKVTDDVTKSLISYLHQGGFLTVLPHNGPWPLHYDSSRKGIPFAITDKLALGVDNGFDQPPDGTELTFHAKTNVLFGLSATASFPKIGDIRWRPASRSRVPVNDVYVPLIQLKDGTGKFQGDAVAYVEHRVLPLSPGKSIYVWMRTAESFEPDIFLPSLYQFISTRLKPLPQNP